MTWTLTAALTASRRLRRRSASLVLSGIAVLLVAQGSGAAPASAQSSSSDAGLRELNRLRAAAGVPAATAAPGGAAQAHARYLALNKGKPEVAGLRTHEEVPGLPGYTPEGAAVAARSNISEGIFSPEQAITGLVDVPLHRHGMVDPGLRSVGIGGEAGHWVVDLSDTRRTTSPLVVAYPGAGQGQVPLTFIGNEVPNPLAAISGIAPDATVGYPITLHFFGCTPRQAQASLTSGGQTVPIHLIQPGTVIRAEGGEREVQMVLLFPQEPLRPSTTYTAQMSASCGTLGQRTYSWSFSTRAAFKPQDTQVAIGAPSADGSQSLTLQFVDAAGLPVAGVEGRGARWSFAWGQGRSMPPAMTWSGPSGPDGRMHITFSLNDAAGADLQVEVEYDGIAATVPVKVARAASGQLQALRAPAEIPVDMMARAAWERDHGSLLPMTMAQAPSPAASADAVGAIAGAGGEPVITEQPTPGDAAPAEGQ
jgi:hypothetical protein